ncbi:hypothetical protein GF369_01685 [Candidatus Peregrinibacteria bacterium]|nr:hypothetical protein [Candidatus Peregrinibacteria bacterium]
MKHRFSHQRALIRKILTDYKGHLSAEEIYERVLKHEPSMSLGTVYRNLHVLEGMGEIRKLMVKEKALYEGERKPHHHIICTRCGMVKNVYKPAHLKCEKCLSWVHDFTVEEAFITAYGVCKQCKK